VKYLVPIFFSIALTISAQPPQGGGPIHRDNAPCLTASQRAELWTAIEANREMLRAAGKLRRARKARPVLTSALRGEPNLEGFVPYGITNYVDHDADGPDALLDYNGGARTYDTESGYDHQGVDYATWPFSWNKMAEDQVVIIASAPGTIVYKESAQPDMSCSFDVDTGWNAVFVEHADGSTAWYGHMKRNSLTSKGVGDTVARGEVLGTVGSSGTSTGPHLHLEIYDSDRNLIDPFAGPHNPTTSESWWEEQEPYRVPSIVDLQTHGIAPVQGCSDEELPSFDDHFSIGETVFMGGYFRDQLAGTTTLLRVIRPDGSALYDWGYDFNNTFSLSWWYWNFEIDATWQTGIWRWESTYEGVIRERAFAVGDIGAPSFTDVSLERSTIGPGESVAVSWQTDNATRVFIDGVGYGNVDGEMMLAPTETTDYTLRASGPGGAEAVATVRITVEGGGERLVGHVTPVGGNFATRVFLANQLDTDQPYALTSYDAGGTMLETVTGSLEAGETMAAQIEHVFPIDGVSHFTVDADPSVQATVSYVAASGGSPAHLHATATTANRWRIYPGNWALTWDGLAVVNSGGETTDVTIRQLSGDGTELTIFTGTPFDGIAPGEKRLANMVALGFAEVADSYFVIEADQPLSVVALRGSLDGTLLWVNLPLVEP